MKRLLHGVGISVIVAMTFGLSVSVRAQATNDQSTASTNRFVGYSTNQFVFKGGRLYDFIEEIRKVYDVNLMETATVPESYLSQVQVPKLRLVKPRGPGNPGQINWVAYSSVLRLYNDLSESGVRGLGKWVIAKDDPGTIVYVPPPADEMDMTRKVRVFSIPTDDPKQIKLLEDSIHATEEFYYNRRNLNSTGEFRYHQASSILIAVGDDTYLNVVAEVVAAMTHSKN
jgi:hypothetical protein